MRVTKVTELEAEWGAAGNLRFLVSSIGSVTPNASVNGEDVYNVFCVGREAYACIEQDQYSASFIYRPPILDTALALNCTVGYKFAEVPQDTGHVKFSLIDLEPVVAYC